MSFYLKEIETVNFRNHEAINVSFHPRLNFIVGPNASGKTSLLDAIYYLSFTKGFMGATDQENIRTQTDFFLVKGNYFRNDSDETVSCGLKKDGKKQFMRNGKEYARFFEHIGSFPLVIVSPYDQGLINGPSEERRKYADSVISQIDRPYLETVLSYAKILKQRNALLKNMAENGSNDKDMLSVYNTQLAKHGNHIYKSRNNFVQAFLPFFNEIYARLSGKSEPVSISYISRLHENIFGDLLEANTQRDMLAGTTTSGPHRDELLFTINGLPAKYAGSQGQQKTFLLSLRLAQYAYIRQTIGLPPLLLLDDIFDKLDDQRVANLLEEVLDHNYGQIFITHTNLTMLTWVLGNLKQDYSVIKLKNGLLDEQR
ncbi:MAG: DNA replication and repair protein RecF [Bacteroidetes bacterium HGW-Bacteroidetes-21]|jgi:DNA replication and repair protein RecF|nr:MAG: DNA replication and repair protein RecF [Bacteroidetes bacterium HGW-Bacteroidetes-21]